MVIIKLAQKEKMKKVVQLLRESNNMLFSTGAGISADSGLPTYRGVSGLYNDQATEEGMPIEMALSGDVFDRDPRITWKYVRQIEEKCRGAKYNKGHQVIAEMEEHFQRVWTLTQNVDGFHRAAGSKNVINIHGDIHQLLCVDCHWQDRVIDFSTLSIPPVCPDCQGVVRPDVVLFGEMLAVSNLNILQAELERGFDLYFSIGTTAVFPYIMQPIVMARQRRIPTIEINPGRSEISDIVDIKLDLGAADALDQIWNLYQQNSS